VHAGSRKKCESALDDEFSTGKLRAKKFGKIKEFVVQVCRSLVLYSGLV